MSKLHEKNWTLEQSGVIRIDDATTLTCHIAPWRLPRVPELDDWKMAEKVSGEVMALVLAAPDMARALLAHGHVAMEPNGSEGAWHTDKCWLSNRAICLPECERDRVALRKAKVMP